MTNSQIHQTFLTFLMPFIPCTTFFQHHLPLQTIVKDFDKPFYLCILYLTLFQLRPMFLVLCFVSPFLVPAYLACSRYFGSRLPLFCCSCQSDFNTSPESAVPDVVGQRRHHGQKWKTSTGAEKVEIGPWNSSCKKKHRLCALMIWFPEYCTVQYKVPNPQYLSLLSTTDLGSISNRNVLSPSSGSWKCEINVPAGLGSGEESLASRWLPSHCMPTWSFL